MAGSTSSASSGGAHEPNAVVWLIALVAILAVLVWLEHRQAIRYAVLLTVYWGMVPFTVLSETAVRIQQSIASHSYAFWTPGRLFTLFDVVSSLYWRWPVIAILVAFGVGALRRSKRARYSARLSLERLAQMMVLENPHIAPTLKLNAYEQPLDGGLLPAPERPIAFALRRELLLDGEARPVVFDAIFERNGTLRDFRPEVRDGRHPIGDYVLPARIDESRAAQYFAAQLRGGFRLRGKSGFSPDTDLRLLPDWAQAFAAAIYAYGADQQDLANDILGTLSLAWEPPNEAVPGGWQWKGAPLRWRSLEEILDGRIDWVETKDPANPVLVDRSYVRGLFPLWPVALSPMVRVRESRDGFGVSREWRLRWQWRGLVWAAAQSQQPARFTRLPTGYRALLAQALRDEKFQELARLHDRHCATWFMALMEWAQRMGSFHTSLFIWLRVQNPTLFWTLNQVGGECAWTQAAGPWTHYRTEIMARSAIEEPAVDLAVRTLSNDIKADGWFDPREGR